jgi:periplasmic divalent cation tolerance protein
MTLLRTTVETEAQAAALVDALVEARLAACVHVHALRSSYWWKGRREDAAEWLVEARVLEERADAAAEAILNSHPYELPLLEALPCRVNEAYADWAKRVS